MALTRARLNWNARHRLGAAALLAALMMVVILGVAALALDIGYLFMNYSQLQSCSDSGSLAGAQVLVHDGLVKAVPEYTTAQANARSTAVTYASSNRVGASLPSVDSNSSNDSGGDVVLGYMSDPSNPSASLDFSNPLLFNAVQVRVRKHADKNGLVESFFSRLWGNQGEAVAARATAVVSSSITGFKVTSESGNSDLLPFGVKKTTWDAMIAGSGADAFKVDSTGAVVSGSDGILEMNMFPVDNGSSGNSGTVDIGNSNNSTADLSRQIRYGVNSSDLAYIGGSLQLGSDGTVQLNGDTGISAGIKDDLESIKGRPRTICLYTTVSGNGNNAMYTVVGFVGVRIMKVKLTGNPKYVTIQPAAVIDASAIIGNTTNSSQYVYSNVRMVR